MHVDIVNFAGAGMPDGRTAERSEPAGPTPLTTRLPAEDESVWLLHCLFVAPGHRGVGITAVLVGAVVELAVHAFLGREELFADQGFE